MDTAFDKLREELLLQPKKWLVTGVAGFIASHLVETLLKLNQIVWGVDNFYAGKLSNLEAIRESVTPEQWARFSFFEGDLACESLYNDWFSESDGVQIVLHQAAFCSVPQSIQQPLLNDEINVTGHLRLLEAARRAKVERFVYASTSAVYGDCEQMPCVEERTGRILSPYGVSKYVNELNADLYARLHGMHCVGLRYFNVFGPRQDPNGAYAAVIPKWISTLLEGGEVRINGDGEQTRDFTYVENVVQANLLAATRRLSLGHHVYNVGTGGCVTLNELFHQIKKIAAESDSKLNGVEPVYASAQPGDIKHSRGDIAKIIRELGYQPQRDLEIGLRRTFEYFGKKRQENTDISLHLLAAILQLRSSSPQIQQS